MIVRIPVFSTLHTALSECNMSGFVVEYSAHQTIFSHILTISHEEGKIFCGTQTQLENSALQNVGNEAVAHVVMLSQNFPENIISAQTS